MNEKEIKILWGRSGNRCAICKLELTPDGEKETLGEMAHIVARSAEGPRGDSLHPFNELDKYSNLVLLCPTHHTEIDKNFSDWSVTRLLEVKAKHESWVSEQLNNGNISISRIDNAVFLENRLLVWRDLSRDHIAIVLSLTPLRISDNQIDTMGLDALKTLEEASLPGNYQNRVNRYHTRPTEHGLVNEKFPDLPDRSGYSFHVFRSGHCEYFQEIGHGTDQITEAVQTKGEDIKGAKYIIRYTDIAEVVDCGLAWLERLWGKVLPYEYMDFQCTILNTRKTTLFSYKDKWNGGVFGYPIRSDTLFYKDILTKEIDVSLLSFDILKWVSSCFGLVLQQKLDSTGEHARPTSMR